MTRHKRALKDNHDRWLVSYADLVTLLFAFFVVLFASTQTDHFRAKQISEGVQKALSEGATPKIAAILGGNIDDTGKEPLKDLSATADLLRERLKQQIQDGAVDVHVEERGVIIGLNSEIFFSTGGDAIDPSVYPTLKEVAVILNRLPNAIRLEGHTDSIPINTPRFPSNWELSAARSIAMLRLFNERFQVNRERMAVVGYADTASLASNETESGRRRNRRVDIVIVSDHGMRTEPAH